MVQAARLVGLGRRLVGGADFLSRLLEDARDLTGIGAVGRQVKVLLIGSRAIGRKNNLVCFGIDGCILNQSLALDVVEERLVRVNFDGLIGSGYLGRTIVFLVENDGLIPQVESGSGGIGFGGRIIGCIRIRNLASSRVDFAESGIGCGDHRQARVLLGR